MLNNNFKSQIITKKLAIGPVDFKVVAQKGYDTGSFFTGHCPTCLREDMLVFINKEDEFLMACTTCGQRVKGKLNEEWFKYWAIAETCYLDMARDTALSNISKKLYTKKKVLIRLLYTDD